MQLALLLPYIGNTTRKLLAQGQPSGLTGLRNIVVHVCFSQFMCTFDFYISSMGQHVI